MIEIDSSFIGDFKLGDNVNFNLAIAAALYEARATTNNATHRRALCKPICITLISVVEAVLHDLHYKVRVFTREGVPNLMESVMEYIRSKSLDKLESLIVSARKHDLLDADPAFYVELDELRQIRNRLHIQNKPPKLAPDEHNVFTPAAVTRAEIALERLLKTMAEKYSRPDQAGYVQPFRLPWEAHLPSQAH